MAMQPIQQDVASFGASSQSWPPGPRGMWAWIVIGALLGGSGTGLSTLLRPDTGAVDAQFALVKAGQLDLKNEIVALRKELSDAVEYRRQREDALTNAISDIRSRLPRDDHEPTRQKR